ncbi:hypothetical protein D9M68_831530 [compost metagenome]
MVVEQGGRGVQCDEPVAGHAHRFVHFLDPLGGIGVGAHQGRQFQAEEGDRFALGAQVEPARQRHADHEHIERGVHQLGHDLLTAGWCGFDARRGGRQAQGHAQGHQRQHGDAQHEVQGLDVLARIAALGEQLAQFDAGVDRHHQQQHDPVQGDGRGAVAFGERGR